MGGAQPRLALALALAGCFGDEVTPFHPGIEPLEDNRAPEPESADGAPYPEALGEIYGTLPAYDWGHARGYVRAPAAEVWRALQDPEVVAYRDASQYEFALDTEPEYELSFEVHYVVEDLIDVEWWEAWRYGTLDGPFDEPAVGLIRYQKIRGTGFIDLLEGSILVRAVEPDVCAMEMIQHVDALKADTDDIAETFESQFRSAIASVRGQPLP